MQRIRSSKSYSKLRNYSLILFIASVGFFILFFADQYFAIRKITVFSEQGKIGVSGLENLQQKNILLISDNRIQQIISEKNPQLTDIQIVKKLPDQLLISVSKEIMQAALVVDQGYFMLNLKGKIIDKAKDNSQNLPTINFYQKLNYDNYSLGDKIDFKEIQVALFLTQKAKDIGLAALSIDIIGEDVIRLNIQNQRVLIFSISKDLNLQDYQFETLIKQFRIEGRDFTSLDFRFDKPIVKLK